MHIRAKAFAIAASVAIIVPVCAFAQSAVQPTFSLNADPQYPAPHSTVTITPRSTSLDLADATLTASVDGKQVYSGNVRSFPITVGAAGVATTLHVVLTSGGKRYTQTAVFHPQDLALVEEPLATTPPLYPGKPDVPPDGKVRLVALAGFANASGKRIDSAALSYDWTIDGTRDVADSGIGKDAVVISSPSPYRSHTVSVLVQSQDGSYSGSASVDIQPGTPQLLVYRDDPLLGILFDHAISGSYDISGSEVSLYGAPYSFTNGNGAPSLKWFVDGALSQVGSSITLRPTGNGKGSANLTLSASDGATTQAAKTLSLTFGSQTSPNLFGL